MKAFFKAVMITGVASIAILSCGKKNEGTAPAPLPGVLLLTAISIDGAAMPAASSYYNSSLKPRFKIKCNSPVNKNSVAGALSITALGGGSALPLTLGYEQADSVIIATPQSPLNYLTTYTLTISTNLQAAQAVNLQQATARQLVTRIDSAAKFEAITDEALLTKIQAQTFKYFWDFGHPVSGMARERSNGDNEVVTSGGTGFGLMCIPVAVSRSFISRQQGLQRLQQVVDFLQNKAVKVKGAYSHWLNGSTGAIIPFSSNDDGADLVETSYLMAGLLTARQFFNQPTPAETSLRAAINQLWNAVEWDWFTKAGQDVLYWHYSDNKQWVMNMPIRGWNECLVTFILATSSTTHAVPAKVYTNGWAGAPGFSNGATFLGYQLPLGPSFGGPLFFAHYSFLGINPNGLKDAYADYAIQTKHHTLINYNHCVNNHYQHFGYSQQCWGLTASDIKNGYTASSPTNDVGVIAPTAALSSLPYTPQQSMQALRFFYDVLGDKLFKEYGFIDAFSLKDTWFASAHLAIDQGPIIIMIENYRTGLVWDLLTSCTEIKNGMKALGFTAPYL
jgi:hypothetical protein